MCKQKGGDRLRAGFPLTDPSTQFHVISVLCGKVLYDNFTTDEAFISLHTVGEAVRSTMVAQKL